jgi:hypothetical protein
MNFLSPERAHERTESMLARAARGITRVVPVRWRGALLFASVLLFFPVILMAMILDAIMHDLPAWRGPFASRARTLADTPNSMRHPIPLT